MFKICPKNMTMNDVKKIFNSIFEVDAAWCNELWLLKSILITLQSQTLTGEIHILYSILFEKPFWFLEPDSNKKNPDK